MTDGVAKLATRQKIAIPNGAFSFERESPIRKPSCNIGLGLCYCFRGDQSEQQAVQQFAIDSLARYFWGPHSLVSDGNHREQQLLLVQAPAIDSLARCFLGLHSLVPREYAVIEDGLSRGDDDG
nr:hypothetical protein Iba_chr08cCG0110 [Ipomoea batatas]